MSNEPSTASTLRFAIGVCLVCSLLVTGSRVLLRDRQLANAELDRQRNVLVAAGLLAATERADATSIEERFATIEALVWDTRERRLVPEADPTQIGRVRDMVPAPDNEAGLRDMPRQLVLYRLPAQSDDEPVVYILPVWGQGLWSTMRAYLAITSTGQIRGVAFYEQEETPGLGGEVSNPRWAASWEDVLAYDNSQVAFEVRSSKSSVDPIHQVDALTGATMTARGVTNLMRFWLGEQGYRSLLQGHRDG